MNSPKIAVMMHGQAGNTDKYGTGKAVDVEISFRHFKERILDVNPHVDIFMHSWSTDRRDKLADLYAPKLEYFEPQIIFDFEYIVGDPNGPGGEINCWHDGKFRGLDNLRFHSLFSRWYSAKMVNELRLMHQTQHGFEYDYVMLTRYDLAYVEDFDFTKFTNNQFYAIPPVSHHGIQDLWFIASNEDMNSLCEMYDWIKRIGHFPHKFTHSHWLTLNYLKLTGIDSRLQFFGSERPWEMGKEGAKLGPSPLVRDYYDVCEATPDSDMGKVRNEIRKASKRKLTW
jgi:hypothetical protein